MRVFLASASLRPSYGGPAVSIPRLATALERAGATVALWAADGSTGAGAAPSTDPMGLAERLRRFAPDVVHDNGLWWRHNHSLATLAGRLGAARVVSTRGMLAPWALGHKKWKKRLAWTLYQRADLRKAALHHATSDDEAAYLRALGLGRPIVVVPNGIDVPDRPAGHDGAPAGKVALFMGRLYPVKGLPMLLEAWASARPSGWSLRIVGPDEAGHRRELERLVRSCGLADCVTFPGEVSGRAKTEEFARASLFVLPSHSESFGMAVGEALAHGLPVLTTTNVPWPELEARGCGWRAEANAAALAQALARATGTDAARLGEMGRRGRDWIEADFAWDAVAARMLRLYETAVAVTAASAASPGTAAWAALQR